MPVLQPRSEAWTYLTALIQPSIHVMTPESGREIDTY